MNSIRKWIFKPKKSDSSLLAQFYYADEDLNAVAAELDSFDGRKEPERCTVLINKLRSCQDKLLCIVEKIMQEAIPKQRANRDFRVKFPDDVMQENLAGQLWFGAECLSAGSSIMNREVESASMRPLARTLTHHLDHMRALLREHSLKSNQYTQPIKTGLVLFDKLFAEFELSYVSAMVPVKTMREYDMLQEVMVLFSETVQRAMVKSLISVDMIDSYDPALMFTIPRLAIVCGLHIYPEGPLNPDMDPTHLSEMFRPFQTLLYKIRELLSTLTEEEFTRLERALCSTEEPVVTQPSQPPQLGGTKEDTGAGQATPPSCATKDRVSANGSESDTEYSSADALSTSSSSSSSGHDDSIESEASCSMTSSPEKHLPTASNTDARKSGTRSKNSAKGAKRMPHQESKDSGMPSESETTKEIAEKSEYFEPQEVASYRLRHSKSWPNAKRRRSQTKQYSGSEMAELTASGGGASIDLIDTSDDDVSTDDDYNTNPLNSRARSSHEFTFSIPADTSLPSYTTTQQDNAQDIPNIPSESQTEFHSRPKESSSDITQSDTSSSDSPSHTNHVSFVTDILSEIFLTDPVEADQYTCNCDESSEQNAAAVIHEQYSEQNNTCTTVRQQNSADENVTADVASGVTVESNDGNKIAAMQSTHCDSQESLKEVVNSSNTETANNETPSLSDNTKPCDKYKCSSQSQPFESNSNETHSTVLCSKCSKRSDKTENKSQPACSRTKSLQSDATQSQEPSSSTILQSGTPRPQAAETENLSALKPSVPPERRYFRSHSCPCKPLLQRPAMYTRKIHDSPRGSQNNKGQNSNKTTVKSKSDSKRSPRSNYSDGSETSSSSSDGGPESENDEITLAIKAAENAARQEARARFKTSDELIHRLFVCISGVADQLQTNYAADLRHILKCVFECNSSEPIEEEETCSDKSSLDTFVNISAPESPDGSFHGEDIHNERGENNNTQNSPDPTTQIGEPPLWVPDDEAAECWSCKVPFTFVRRRHHCRNCGKIFCGRCSSNNVPLPQYGHHKPVRVCNRCFMFHVTPFTVDSQE